MKIEFLVGDGAERFANGIPKWGMAGFVDDASHLGDDHGVKSTWGHGHDHESTQREESSDAGFAVVWMEEKSAYFGGVVLPTTEMENL